MSRAPRERIKILYTIPNFITAGSGKALWNVASRLDPDVFSSTIAVLKRGGTLEAEIEEAGVPLLELPFTVPARPLHRLPPLILQAARRFRPYEFDIWHSYHYLDDYTEPLIARASGAQAWIYTKKSMSWGSRAWKIRSVLASRIPAMNTTMLTQFFSHPIFRGKALLIPPSVDTDVFRPTTPTRMQLRDKLDIGNDTTLIGCVAHLLPVKGQKYLLQAVASIPNVHLVLAGRPDDQQYAVTLHHLCKDSDITERVHFLGNVSDIPALHSELDMFVLPSLARGRMEGCPVALLEAMSSGLPCVASRIPGVEDVIQDGKNGVLTSPEDEASLSAAIQRLSTNASLRSRLGKEARMTILENYTTEREVAQYEALYMSLSGVTRTHKHDKNVK